ncbi:hypothetical protein Tco_0672038 [Tanacetum coccineum]
MTNTKDQPSGTDDLAAKVDKLSKDLESVISWIRDQLPKAHVTPVKERYAEYMFEDNDIEDGDDNNKKVNGPHYPFKVKARIDIPTYDGTVDAEKLDFLIDQLKTYFTLYGFSSINNVVYARLKLTSHALPWWNSQLKTRGEDVNASSIAMAIEQKNKTSGENFGERSKGEGLSTGFLKNDFKKGMTSWIKDDRMKHTTATNFVDDTIELRSIEEADKSLSLMVGPQKNSQNTQVKPGEKEELFTMIQVKHEVIESIVDTSSQKNLILATLVRKLGLPTTQHPSPYSLGWISNNMDT